jgi:hypothetical protein
MKTPDPVALLLRILDEAYEKKAWHGPNLRGTLRGVSVQEAVWRPAPDRHNVWELALHAAYWKYAGWRRLTGQKRGAFPVEGSNWFARPEPSPRPSPRGRGRETATEKAWRSDLALLDGEHRRFRAAVEKIPVSRLSSLSRGSKHRVDTLVYGIAAHDVYHAGQIQLVKRLFRDRVGRSPRG